jgi:hypothetical protein
MRNKDHGWEPTMSQQHMFSSYFFPERRSELEKIIIHHVTDTPHILQMEVERRCPINGIKFERFILKR